MSISACDISHDDVGDGGDLLGEGALILITVAKPAIETATPREHGTCLGESQAVTLAAGNGLERDLIYPAGTVIFEQGHPREVKSYLSRLSCFQDRVAEAKAAVLADTPRVNVTRLGQCQREAIAAGDSGDAESVQLMEHSGR